MIKSREDYEGNIFYEVIGDFEERKNGYGYEGLSINGLIEVLTLLQKEGYGDKLIGIGYDADICYTTIDTKNIIFRVNEDELLFNGDG